MKESTENLILEHLYKFHVVTVNRLSHNLGMTKPDIHYHLQKMLRNEIVEIIKEENPSARGRGRPEVKYKLSTKKTANNYSELCDLLLSQSCITSKKGGFLKNLAKRMIPPVYPGFSLTRSLNFLMEELNNRAYLAHWEAHKNGPVIMFSACPYLALIEKHPELCLLDTEILSNYLNYSVKQIRKIEYSLKSPSECVFVLGKACASTAD
jgi:predicted ArsR family transcriptional regulator